MLDNDDLDFAILAWPSEGWVIGILGVIVILILAAVVASNEDTCAKKHCERGNPVLMKHGCLCVEKAE